MQLRPLVDKSRARIPLRLRVEQHLARIPKIQARILSPECACPPHELKSFARILHRHQHALQRIGRQRRRRVDIRKHHVRHAPLRVLARQQHARQKHPIRQRRRLVFHQVAQWRRLARRFKLAPKRPRRNRRTILHAKLQRPTRLRIGQKNIKFWRHLVRCHLEDEEVFSRFYLHLMPIPIQRHFFRPVLIRFHHARPVEPCHHRRRRRNLNRRPHRPPPLIHHARHQI